MDGDFAPMVELVELHKKHNLLHMERLFVARVAEEFDCERDVDICIGTLSKATGCQGGFIACSHTSLSCYQKKVETTYPINGPLPVPIVAAAHRKVQNRFNETCSCSFCLLANNINATLQLLFLWHRRALWNRVQDFHAPAGIPYLQSNNISYCSKRRQCPKSEQAIGEIWFPCDCNQTTNCALELLQVLYKIIVDVLNHIGMMEYLVYDYFQVPLSAAHTTEDFKKLTSAISSYTNFHDINNSRPKRHSKLNFEELQIFNMYLYLRK
ncbi:hypothetical protein PTKIN_Ptkin05aG0221000 [Pterospermum kingtungense]